MLPKHCWIRIVFVLGVASAAVVVLLPYTVAQQLHQKNSNNKNDVEMEQRYYRNDMERRLEQTIENEDESTNNNCSNICTDKSSSVPLSSSFIKVQLTDGEVEEDDEGDFLLGWLGRLLNRIFRFIIRRSESKSRATYVASTTYILSELTMHSGKFLSLSQLIRNESSVDSQLATTGPDILETMYTLSAENLESTSMALNYIAASIERQQESYGGDISIDVLTLVCTMMKFVTLLQDITIPNIEMMMSTLYTDTSNNDELREMYYQHTKTSKQNGVTGQNNSNHGDIDSNNLKEECKTTGTVQTLSSASSSLSSSRLFFGGGIILPGSNVGIIQHISYIIILIMLFPLSIVISILSLILIVFVVIFYTIVTGDILTPFQDDSFGTRIFIAATVGLPVVIIQGVLRNIAGLVEDLINPTVQLQISSSTQILDSTESQGLNPRDPSFVNETIFHLNSVLQSPIDMIYEMAVAQQNVAGRIDWNQKGHDESQCQLDHLICKRNAMFDAIPF